MYIVFLALINTLLGTILTIKWKGLITKGLNSVSALGLLCFGIPLWLATLIVLSYKFDIVYSSEYFLYVLLWSAVVILTNLGSLFLIKSQALSEFTLYKLGFSTVLGFIIDLVYFKTNFSLSLLIGVFLLFISGTLLSKNKKTKNVNIISILFQLLILSVLIVFQYSVYKYAQAVQPSPIIHGVISQLVVYISFSFFAFGYLRKDYKLRIYNRKDIVDFSLLIFLFTVTEAFLIKELPITVLMLLSVISLLIYIVYDIKKKEIVLSKQIFLAGALSTTALIMINIGN